MLIQLSSCVKEVAKGFEGRLLFVFVMPEAFAVEAKRTLYFQFMVCRRRTFCVLKWYL